MRTGRPGLEKSRSVEDMHHMRLMALLNELVRDKGVMKAAEALDVDHRTLTSSMQRGRLSRRMRVALDKALLEGAGSPAAEQRGRIDEHEGRIKAVEDRVDAVEKELGKGLAAVRDKVKSVRGGLDRVQRRLAQHESGRDAQDDADELVGESGEVARTSLTRREFPDLVTIEPADDDEEVFGEAWPLIAEWRRLKESHPNQGKGLDWLVVEERFLSIELALLEEHGLTLPPETFPLRGLERSGQVSWRRTALSDTRRALARAELLRRVTFGLWR